MASRVIAAVAASVTVAALALQVGLTIASHLADGEGVLAALWRLAGFFTNWGNAAAAVVASAMALVPSSSLAGPRARLAALAAIVLVGIVFAILLRENLTSATGLQAVASRLLHDVTPVLFVLAWAASGHGTLRAVDAAWALVLPAAYLAIVLVRGATEGFVPYWFLDLEGLGAAGYARNAALLALAFAALGLLIVAADRTLGRIAGHAPAR
ncbi:Pr6Pr family membrane protein [Acuticoccus sp.]|uniref:Pr6Pr family membrane protein n=1 Tax=Acuticoccus sp. TaxID=1904378 RepID=UPI003B52897B